eukprot:CAMPEP_0206510492 /NCGR_PEP_ID=MMETSP0324_2-20121206/59684_2 /ASSEMBLY_ACC=CAM_ASM_000836 /TAXON_ID=2866 /ORGANISM="Crypthecodinium cohnii, Strain Seligo" /LENGTH=289 /DNA_ID=CAMNT_0054002005 /DNA_START=1 /DNA_END=867 /DNA_ORIENTATION=-
MDMLTGENITASYLRKPPDSKAAVLRAPGANYEISRHAYRGAFRYRGAADEDNFDRDDLELDMFEKVCIYGTWSNYTEMEEMTSLGGGKYGAKVVLGETRCELFRLCLNHDRSQEIYPLIDRATEKIWIEGPDEGANRRSWLIDGRADKIPAGTSFDVVFQWHPERKSIMWSRSSERRTPTNMPAFRHNYSLFGSFSAGQLVSMAPSQDGGRGYLGRFRIGAAGEEEFQIIRDGDFDQTIYPAVERAIRASVPVRGPDNLGGSKGWLVQGRSGDIVEVSVQVEDGLVIV